MSTSNMTSPHSFFDDENEREPEREKSNVLFLLRWAKERDPNGTDNITTNVNERALTKTGGGSLKKKEQTYACDEGGGGREDRWRERERVISVMEEWSGRLFGAHHLHEFFVVDLSITIQVNFTNNIVDFLIRQLTTQRGHDCT